MSYDQVIEQVTYIEKSFSIFNIFCEWSAPPDKSEPRLAHWQPTIDSARKAQWFVKWSFRRAMYNFYNFYNFYPPLLREILKFLTLVGTSSSLGGFMWKSLFSIFNLEAPHKGNSQHNFRFNDFCESMLTGPAEAKNHQKDFELGKWNILTPNAAASRVI